MEIVKATLVYLVSDGKTLMLQKEKRIGDPNSRKFTQPGGKIELELKETPIQAACRETFQETGITLINPTYTGTVLFDNTERAFSDMPATKHFLVHCFRASEYSGTLTGTKEGTPIWVENNKLKELNRHEGDCLIDSIMADGRKFSAVIYHVGTKLCQEKTYVTYFD